VIFTDLIRAETALLSWLPKAAVLTGQQWVDRQRAAVAATAYQKIVVSEFLGQSDSLAEAAVGFLEVGDYAGAVSAARAAVWAAIDAMLFSRGEPGVREKWRARRIAQVKAESVTPEQYWEFETMRNFEEANPGAWVEAALQWRMRIALDIDIEVD
jgi:hypothetical protein